MLFKVHKEAYRAEFRLKNNIIAYAEKKSVEVNPAISPSDLDTKLSQAKRMLAKNHPVQFTVKPSRLGSDLLQDKVLMETIITKLEEEGHEKGFAGTWLHRKLLIEPGKAKVPYVSIKPNLPEGFVDPDAKKQVVPKVFKAGKGETKRRTRSQFFEDGPPPED